MPYDMWHVRETNDADYDVEIRNVFRDCGWPSKAFRREECFRRVEKVFDDFRSEMERQRNTENI